MSLVLRSTGQAPVTLGLVGVTLCDKWREREGGETAALK